MLFRCLYCTSKTRIAVVPLVPTLRVGMQIPFPHCSLPACQGDRIHGFRKFYAQEREETLERRVIIGSHAERGNQSNNQR